MTAPRRGKADIFDVARRAGVSISTVSRAFNHPRKVHPATRRRVEAAVAELGYIRNRAAQAIHGIRLATIGMVVPTIDHAIFAELIQSFSEAVEAGGFTILMDSHRYDLDREVRIVRKFLEHRVDGVALIGLEHSPELMHLLAQQGTPVLALWNWRADAELPCIGADNREAGRLAAEHLIALGHTDIALAFPPLAGNDRARARHEGARARLAEAGIEPPPARVVTAPYTARGARSAVARLIAKAPLPGAILCGNDVIGQGAVFALQRAGVAVGREVSVIGIGDFRWSADMVPALTTVRLPARRIGRLAGQMLSAAIAASEPPGERVLCPCTLVVRESCGPPLGPPLRPA